MEEVEATILDGDRVLVSGVTALLDIGGGPLGPSGEAQWHAHMALPLDFVLEPGEQMRFRTTDGRSGPVAILGSPEVEGDRMLFVFTGLGPLEDSAV
jgi:hypothetical protein